MRSPAVVHLRSHLCLLHVALALGTSLTAAAQDVDGGVTPEQASSSFTLHGSVRAVATGVTAFPLDALGTPLAPWPLETRLRLGPEFRFRGFGLITEFDVFTGAIVGTPGPSLVATRVSVPSLKAIELRQAYLEYRWAWGGARLGLQTNQFGLGMLASAGAKDAEAGDFGHQHFGSLALRALVVSRPLLSLGGAFQAIEPVAAFDLVVRDSTVDLLEGDRALQGILGVRFNVDEKNVLSLVGIYRNQRPLAPDGDRRFTEVFVLDASAQWNVIDRLDLGAEVAGITGSTWQTRSPEQPVLQVRQLGAVAKASYRVGRWGFLFDAGYASGDADPYDSQLTSFRFDRDFKAGLILFDHVLAWQSARGAFRASDLSLVGVAPEGVALLPTGGAVTGAWYLFPRVRARLGGLVDVYGGPLFAFTSAPLTDPFNTRVLAGGVPVNALNGPGRGALGTELDLGASVKWRFSSGITVTAMFEGGAFLPGPALTRADGALMPPVWLGRVRLGASL